MTVRTNAAITALLPDNSPNRLISEADIRDLWDTTIARSRRYSVKQYGALGNDTGNDSAAIQACIDAVSNDGGGVAFMPAGIYRITTGIVIKNRVMLEGEFGGTSIRANSPIAGFISTTGTAAMTGARNLTLDGRRATMGGDLTSIGLFVNHTAGPNSSFGTNSIIGGELEHAYALFENLTIAGVAGWGVKAAGSGAVFNRVDCVGVNKVCFETTMVGAMWQNCGMNGGREEGWICGGQDSVYKYCKSSFCGTGGNTAFGDYALGAGFRITAPNQTFVDCEGMDTDGPAFLIQASHTHLSGCFSTQGCNLTGTSAAIGQSPLRGGGWAASGARRSGFEIRGNTSYCKIDGHAKDKLVATANDPNLNAAVIVDGGDGNLISVGGDPRILATVGSTPWVINEGTNTTIVHDYNGAI